MQKLQHLLSDKLTILNTNRLIELKHKPSNRNTDFSLVIDCALVPAKWRLRHYKAIHAIGLNRYQELADRARRYGRNPEKLLAHLIDKELNSKSPGEVQPTQGLITNFNGKTTCA